MPALVGAVVAVSVVAAALVAVEGCFWVVVVGAVPVVAPVPELVQAQVLAVAVLAGLHPIRMGGSHFSLSGAEVLQFL